MGTASGSALNYNKDTESENKGKVGCKIRKTVEMGSGEKSGDGHLMMRPRHMQQVRHKEG